MKKNHFPLIFTLVILGSFLLSACTGGAVVNSWPGLAASQDTIYLAGAGKIYAINAQNGVVSCSFPEKADNAKPFYAAPAVTDEFNRGGELWAHAIWRGHRLQPEMVL